MLNHPATAVRSMRRLALTAATLRKTMFCFVILLLLFLKAILGRDLSSIGVWLHTALSLAILEDKPRFI